LRQRNLEPLDLCLAFQNRSRSRIPKDGLIESIDDDAVVRPHRRAHSLQTVGGLGVEPDVFLQ